jgi:hypothetical protein
METNCPKTCPDCNHHCQMQVQEHKDNPAKSHICDNWHTW